MTHRFNTAQATWKLVRVGSHLALGWWTVKRIFPRLDWDQKQQQKQAWALTLLALLAIKLEVSGEPAQRGPVLLVANHISWLDIVVLMATCPCRFVAKAEVGHWPLLGTLATGLGTLFVTRESPRDAVRVVHQMAEHLQAGDLLAIFPEGTTSQGTQLLPFHANLFQAAVSAGAPVQPVALQFIDAASGEPSLAPCYINDDSLLQSIWRTLTVPTLCAAVRFGEPQNVLGRDRRALARDVRGAVDALRQPAAAPLI